MPMVKHFGVSIREKNNGLKLTRDNYMKVSNKSSFHKGKVYTDLEINEHKERCLYNYDLNMKYFQSLSKEDFNKDLMEFDNKTKVFKEITNLAPFDSISGYYIMVLDKYAQVYIGTSEDIKRRIRTHWSKQKEFDRLIFGGKDSSILSIDSFRAYDTTRIFVYPTHELYIGEDGFINLFNKRYLLNRTGGVSICADLLDLLVKQRMPRWFWKI
ncbi:GIY-YIG nuclease family protein [Oceanobacillus piezotolerans]|uniref:GIY-YIG nuclease family protein n=1 Tax=Oceanobacillus piezotolerans TaxID=2448030 RepID=A0A498D958_9BACI|nr:GIY-YIG nuclease family protein [Oceanobacillus piezotolerans]RLL47833.1 GIY-YIG nuclease family protein [Oceanobacillus piezotolerans]